MRVDIGALVFAWVRDRFRVPTVVAVVVLALLCATSISLRAQERAGVTAELRALYQADQADRQFTTPPTEEDWEIVSSRDEERLRRVYELLRGDNLSAAEDFYHAAMILQHGETSEDVLLAHILSTAAGFLGDARGRWLSAAALDRYLLRTRMPQRLGTQYFPASTEDPFQPDTARPMGQGPYVRWLPDSVREIFDVPPLEEQAEAVREMNRGSGG
ncbi:MAG: hypothetical protein PVJ76_10995 [Gemmatimonadota bacterium]